MSTPKPTIIIVPGSFAPPTIYSTTINHLRDAGYPAVAIQLPSTTKRMPLEPANMSDDASVIKRVVETLLSQGKQVVVICHSYGGTPTSQALVGLGVKRLVYLSAIVPKLGQSNVMAMGGEDGVLPMEAVSGYLHIDPVLMAGAVANDMPWELAYENVLQFPHHSAASFLENVTQVAYTDLAVSYILCKKDLVISPELQSGFIKVIEEASEKKVDVVELECGHCPNWSMPEKLAEAIIGEVERSG